jgi:LmbE family N-acetylglucosaminyl deacetylase
MTDRILCIVTHPDDETLFAAGILSMLVESGMPLHILCATRGEGGEAGDPPIVDHDRLGAIREEETRCAAKALGATSLHFLDYVDPPVGEDNELYPYTDDYDELVEVILAVIEDVRPKMVLTHGSKGEYGHPAHRLTHRAVLAAHAQARERGHDSHLYTFSAAVPGLEDRVFNINDRADIVIDIHPWLDVKAEAAACHRTQYGLFFRNHPEAHTVRDIVRTVESLHRVYPREGPDLEPLQPFRVEEWQASASDLQREEWKWGL